MTVQLEVVQDLQQRRGLFTVCVEMLYDTGMACEKQGMDKEAREAFATMCVLLDQIDHYDQAMAAIEGGALQQKQVDMTCGGCGEKNGVTAFVNIMLQDDESAGWEPVVCCSCGNEIGQVRRDHGGMTKGYVVTAAGVTNFELDDRTIEERKKEAKVFGDQGVAKPDELPGMDELKAKLVESATEPIAVASGESQQRTTDSRAINDLLKQARSKVLHRVEASPPSDEDDF